MYRLLIADDEPLEREGLELMIRRMMPGQFEFIHAENGRQAILLAEEQRPDFMFVDIRMPGIQGIEAIREITARHPSIKFVMVTAHDYFTYAKEAITLGVKDYLLKPARLEEVRAILDKLVAEREEELRKREEELELREKLSRLLPLAENELTLTLMLEYVQEMDLEHLSHLMRFQWHKGYAMLLTFSRQSKKDWEYFQQEKRRVYEAVKHYMKPRLPCMISPLIGNQMTLFIPVPADRPFYSYRVEALEWGERLQSFVETQVGLPAVLGIGSVQKGLEGLRRSFREAVLVSAEPNAVAGVRHIDDIEQSSGQPGIPLEEEKKLLDAMHRQDKEEAAARFDLLFERLQASVSADLERCRNEVTGLFVALYRQLNLGVPSEILSSFQAVQDTESLRQAAEARLRQMLDGLREERDKRQFHVIERAKSYILQTYQQDVSMEQTAEYVNLSPYYFSKLFKQYVGETFVDHLTRLRIERAKRLLSDETLCLKEICYEIGYNDPNYFSRVFKRVTGITPREYRQQSGSGDLPQ